MHRVKRIHNIDDAINAGHERHHDQVVPTAKRTAVRGSWIVLEAVKRPYNHCRQVHQNRQHVVPRKTLLKRKGALSQQPTDGQEDDEESNDEADGIDGHAPLQPRKPAVPARVQRDEDDAGDERLQDLQQAGHSGQEPADLPGFGSGQAYFHGVQDEGQTGDHRSRNPTGARRAHEKLGVDDRGRQDHQGGQHGESRSEVLPRDGHLGVEVGQLQDDDEESHETAEAPGEHTPGPV